MRGLELSVRRFARRPGRGAAAALTLAIGIGATSAAFAAVDAVLLRDLPVDRQEELIVGWRLNEERPSIRVPFRTEEYDFLSSGQRSLSGLAGFTAWGALPVLVENASPGYTLNEVRVAGDFFGVAGTHPTIGRLLTADDDQPGAGQVAVLSHRIWRTRFGSDPDVVGLSLSMRGRTVTIVGVGPRGFDFPLGTDIWVPLQGAPFELHVTGRVAPGGGPAGVASDFSAVFSAGASQGIDVNSDLRPVVVPLRELIVGSVAPVLVAASAAALLLLLAGAANATLFLLVAGRTAAHDRAVRKALGAKRGHVVSQLLADASLLAAFGTAAGLLLAWVALRTLVPLAPPELPRLEAISLGSAASLFGLTAGAVCGVLAGLSAGLVLSRLGESRGIVAREGRRHSALGGRFRRLVAGIQVGLAVVSVVGAGLLARTVLTIDRLDLGLSADDMTVFDLRIPYGFGRVPDAYMEALESVVLDLEARPGVLAARATLGPPCSSASRSRCERRDRTRTRRGTTPSSRSTQFCPGTSRPSASASCRAAESRTSTTGPTRPPLSSWTTSSPRPSGPARTRSERESAASSRAVRGSRWLASRPARATASSSNSILAPTTRCAGWGPPLRPHFSCGRLTLHERPLTNWYVTRSPTPIRRSG